MVITQTKEKIENFLEKQAISSYGNEFEKKCSKHFGIKDLRFLYSFQNKNIPFPISPYL
jgi:hypothetical protein